MPILGAGGKSPISHRVHSLQISLRAAGLPSDGTSRLEAHTADRVRVRYQAVDAKQWADQPSNGTSGAIDCYCSRSIFQHAWRNGPAADAPGMLAGFDAKLPPSLLDLLARWNAPHFSCLQHLQEKTCGQRRKGVTRGEREQAQEVFSGRTHSRRPEAHPDKQCRRYQRQAGVKRRRRWRQSR